MGGVFGRNRVGRQRFDLGIRPHVGSVRPLCGGFDHFGGIVAHSNLGSTKPRRPRCDLRLASKPWRVGALCVCYPSMRGLIWSRSLVQLALGVLGGGSISVREVRGRMGALGAGKLGQRYVVLGADCGGGFGLGTRGSIGAPRRSRAESASRLAGKVRASCIFCAASLADDRPGPLPQPGPKFSPKRATWSKSPHNLPKAVQHQPNPGQVWPKLADSVELRAKFGACSIGWSPRFARCAPDATKLAAEGRH